MAAVPIYVWNGTAWQETGPTIPASPIKYQTTAPTSPSTGDIWIDSDADVTSGSQQFQRFRFVASGGETTISGADANGAVLAYTAGAELVVLNGSTLVRGQDYTATNGTSITGLSPALVANDVLEVFSFIAFTVANTYTQAQVDGLIATANASSGSRLLVPGSAVNGTVSAKGTVTFSGVTSVSINDVFSATYERYLIIPSILGSTTITQLLMRMRVSGTDNSSTNYREQFLTADGASAVASRDTGRTNWEIGTIVSTIKNNIRTEIAYPFESINTVGMTSVTDIFTGNIRFFNAGLGLDVATSYTGFTLIANSGTMSGSVSIYGYNE